MRKTSAGMALVVALALPACAAKAQTHVGVGYSQGELDYFHAAIGDVYGMPVGPMPGWVHPDELPVVYLLAREAGVSPSVVIALREQGWSWLDITYHLGVDPYLYVHRLPAGYGYWGYPRVRDYRWLTDRHIVDYVNLVFWADYHRRPVRQVIVYRQRVPSWVVYVKYHAPPRTVVVHRNAPRFHERPSQRPTGRTARPATPRRAELRDAAPAPPAGLDRRTAPNRPSAAPTRPTTAPSRPSAAPTRPTAAPQRPSTAPQRPSAVPQRPTAVQQRPTAVQQRPTAVPQRPGAAPQRPTAVPQRPNAAPSRPAAAPSRPSAAPSRPAAAPSRPSAAPSRPAASSSRPSASSSRPSTPSRPQRPSSRPGGD